MPPTIRPKISNAYECEISIILEHETSRADNPPSPFKTAMVWGREFNFTFFANKTPMKKPQKIETEV